MNSEHPLCGRKTIAMEDILDEIFFFASSSSSVQLRFNQALRARGYALPRTQECPSVSNMVNFIQAGMGITLMSARVARSYTKQGLLYIPVEPCLRTETALIAREEGLSESMKVFRDYFHTNIPHSDE